MIEAIIQTAVVFILWLYSKSHKSMSEYVSVLEFKTNRTPGKLITLTGIRYLSLLVLPILSPSISLI